MNDATRRDVREAEEAEQRRLRDLSCFLCGYAYAKPEDAGKVIGPSELTGDCASLFAGLLPPRNAAAVMEWFRLRRAEIANGTKAPEAAALAIRSVALQRIVARERAAIGYVADNDLAEVLRRAEQLVETLRNAGVK